MADMQKVGNRLAMIVIGSLFLVSPGAGFSLGCGIAGQIPCPPIVLYSQILLLIAVLICFLAITTLVGIGLYEDYQNKKRRSKLPGR
jgi:hypothetical protein